MVCLDGILCSIRMNQFYGQWFIRSEILQVDKVEGVILLNEIIVMLICKSYSEHSLFLQVGFMDPGKGF